ncbi:MAG: hypothetical protein GYB35_02810 [Algicola sp.]|nr:hypothetical protein [Algicola sp.]
MKLIVLDMVKYSYKILLFFLFSVSLSAQTKNEKESRIQLSEFPENAQILIQPIISDVRRIKHYKEIDGEYVSFESKFKYKKYWYSVEFSRLGILEDIEVEIKERNLESIISKTINLYLKENFIKYDIIKIQEQYVADSSTEDTSFLKSVLENRNVLNSNYELIIAVKSSEDWQLKEMTFGPKGEFLSSRNIQQGSYEYILY